MSIDLNCDMGEGVGHDAAIMPFISSANIACGYHAGDTATMRDTMLLAKEYGVSIGAHPSYPDRANFGRTNMTLPPHSVFQLVQDQVRLARELADGLGLRLRHVKPHGALYNMSAKDPELAAVIARAVAGIDNSLVLFGLSGSCSITAGQKAGLATASEVFADRSYQDDGSLTPRSQPGALITDVNAAVAQALMMAQTQSVASVSGKNIHVNAQTICIHGDGPNAVGLARAIHHQFNEAGIVIQSAS